MNVNYNLDHRLFRLPIFEEKLTGTERFVLFIVLNQIYHFNKHVGYCDLYVSQMAIDFNVRKDFFSRATKLLIKYRYIKCIVPWSRITQTPARYQIDTGCISEVTRLGLSENQARSQRDPVKNSKRILKEESDRLDRSSSSGAAYPVHQEGFDWGDIS